MALNHISDLDAIGLLSREFKLMELMLPCFLINQSISDKFSEQLNRLVYSKHLFPVGIAMHNLSTMALLKRWKVGRLQP